MVEFDAHDAELLRRAATACRNLHESAINPGTWFLWVPSHLDQLAARIETDDNSGSGADG